MDETLFDITDAAGKRMCAQRDRETGSQQGAVPDVVAVGSIITDDGRCYGYYWTVEDVLAAWPRAEKHYGPGVRLFHSRGIVRGTRPD